MKRGKRYGSDRHAGRLIRRLIAAGIPPTGEKQGSHLMFKGPLDRFGIQVGQDEPLPWFQVSDIEKQIQAAEKARQTGPAPSVERVPCGDCTGGYGGRWFTREYCPAKIGDKVLIARKDGKSASGIMTGLASGGGILVKGKARALRDAGGEVVDEGPPAIAKLVLGGDVRVRLAHVVAPSFKQVWNGDFKRIGMSVRGLPVTDHTVRAYEDKEGRQLITFTYGLDKGEPGDALPPDAAFAVLSTEVVPGSGRKVCMGFAAAQLRTGEKEKPAPRAPVEPRRDTMSDRSPAGESGAPSGQPAALEPLPETKAGGMFAAFAPRRSAPVATATLPERVAAPLRKNDILVLDDTHWLQVMTEPGATPTRLRTKAKVDVLEMLGTVAWELPGDGTDDCHEYLEDTGWLADHAMDADSKPLTRTFLSRIFEGALLEVAGAECTLDSADPEKERFVAKAPAGSFQISPGKREIDITTRDEWELCTFSLWEKQYNPKVSCRVAMIGGRDQVPIVGLEMPTCAVITVGTQEGTLRTEPERVPMEIEFQSEVPQWRPFRIPSSSGFLYWIPVAPRESFILPPKTPLELARTPIGTPVRIYGHDARMSGLATLTNGGKEDISMYYKKHQAQLVDAHFYPKVRITVEGAPLPDAVLERGGVLIKQETVDGISEHSYVFVAYPGALTWYAWSFNGVALDSAAIRKNWRDTTSGDFPAVGGSARIVISGAKSLVTRDERGYQVVRARDGTDIHTTDETEIQVRIATGEFERYRVAKFHLLASSTHPGNFETHRRIEIVTRNVDAFLAEPKGPSAGSTRSVKPSQSSS